MCALDDVFEYVVLGTILSSTLALTVDDYTGKIYSYVNGVLWTIIAVEFKPTSFSLELISLMMPQVIKS